MEWMKSLLSSVAAVFTPSWWKSKFARGDKKQKLPPVETPKADEALAESEQPAAPNVVRQYEDHPSSAYMELKLKFRDIGRLNAIAETMGRDFLTAMPEGAWKTRLGQIAFLHRRIHEDLTSRDIEAQLERAKTHLTNHEEDWDSWDSANLREMDNMFENQRHIAPDLVERRARLSYEGRRAHRDALKNSDWPMAREFLSNIVDLQRQISDAKCKATGVNSHYQSLMNDYMPDVSVMDVEDWFGTLDKKLHPMMDKIVVKQEQEEPPLGIDDYYPAKAQMWLNHALLESIGFDFQRGGLYETGHNPVEGGTPEDTRLVIKNVDTRYFLDSMKSALHEGGHGIYIQNLPRKTWRYQPVGQDMGAAIHESQALIVEMIIGRTKAFFDFLAPRVEGLFHGLHNPMLSAENLHKIKTRVQPSLLRKNADEVSYFFHMKHRFELERDLIEGRLKVSDLPETWNGKMEEIMGQRPENYADGCLQDVHWFVGKFGYFPSYTIGHMLAAQLFQSIDKEVPNIEHSISRGNFKPMTDWLGQRIHSKGRLMPMQDLITTATGKALSPAPLLKHLEARYLAA
jgi:carboxypeptidase Taq